MAFTAHPGRTESAAGPDALFERSTGQAGHPHRRSRRIADPHFAETDDVATVVAAHRSDRSAAFDGQFHLLARHGRRIDEITRPAANLQVDQSVGGRQLGVDAGIDHSQPETVLPTPGN